MSKNEKKTENITRKHLENMGYYSEENIKVENEISDNPRIYKLLKNASKGGVGRGKIEFIITNKQKPDSLIIIECKADTKFHESHERNKAKDYAVDGVLHYASYLSKEFNVIAIAISGENEQELKIDTFLYPKNGNSYSVLESLENKPIQEILDFEQFYKLAVRDKTLEKIRFSELIKYSKELHNFLRDYAKLSESEKPLLVSGLLLALQDDAFSSTWEKLDQEKTLPKQTFEAIARIIDDTQLGDESSNKKTALVQAYKFIEYHPVLTKIIKNQNESPLYKIIKDLASKVKPFIQDHTDYDVIGQFYGEFLRYTGGDKQGLGIVLTPKHITELFAKLAKLTPKDTILDTCTGTASFLISAMDSMLKQANESEKERIYKEALIGVELQPNMFALAVSNMILRGDGKTNLFQGDSFDPNLIEKIKAKKPTVGFINPPYSQKGENLHEWDFIINMLNLLQKSGTGIVIVPMSMAIAKHPLREVLLKNHRLEAVMSMPDDLFYPVGVVTCIMVFTAHTPHDSDKYHESWFGYWKNDGFIKDKREGRIPKSKQGWEEKMEEWVKAYTNKKEIAGFSVNRKVSVDDEWCAEAYLETDYSNLKDEDFEIEARKYLAFLVKNQEKLDF